MFHGVSEAQGASRGPSKDAKQGTDLDLVLRERRKAMRYPLILPIVVRLPNGDGSFCEGLTSDISSKGVRFMTDVSFEVGTSIRYTVALLSERGQQKPLDLCCVGKIVRAEELPGAPKRPYSVAVEVRKHDFRTAMRSNKAATAP